VFALTRSARARRSDDEHATQTRSSGASRTKPRRWHAGFWLVTAALFGPVIGVSCMQWALQVLESSALVVAITATSPLVILPLARWMDNDRPTRLALAGTVVSVTGVILVGFARNGWHW
jgi:drug/metabolite transporter (DMT)-like permease